MVLNILYLSEDDEMIFEFLGYSLSESLDGKTIKNFIADNEEDAIEILEFNNINLIVADMNIKSIYSFEFYDKLHADVKFTNIPFVFLSSSLEDQEISILKGVNNFLLKPLDVDNLLATILDVLSKPKEQNSYIDTISEDYFLGDNGLENNSFDEILLLTNEIEKKIELNDIESIKTLNQQIKDIVQPI
jgi:CheY-like chemotaxis protein